MQFLLMCCFDEEKWEKIPEAQRDKVMGEYHALLNRLAKRGHLRAGAKLKPSATAVTVREKNGKPTMTDGPFAETKEQLGGYHLIECKDLDEAIAIAESIPTLPLGGSVEVRAIDFQEIN